MQTLYAKLYANRLAFLHVWPVNFGNSPFAFFKQRGVGPKCVGTL